MSYKPFTTKHTWQIIDDIKEYLEETNKDQTTLDTLDLCHLIGEIERLNNKLKDIKSQLDYLETFSSEEDVFEDMKRRLNRIESIVNRK